MAQECGFFNAQLVGEDEYDRVYNAEQFAAYFASFIGNGIFGQSMQKLEVLAQLSPNMSVKVLPGEAWINGWWYRNKDEYTLSLDVADGVLHRIDLIVLRWGNQERDMWLDVVKGAASSHPIVPNIRRDADYYDLQLATVSITAGSIRVTQAQIQDTRLDNAVCGLVTGVVDQIDTTNLYNQFTSYFEEFKQGHEADFDNWSAEQKQAYVDYITAQKVLYDQWIADTQDKHDSFIDKIQASYQQWIDYRDQYEQDMINHGNIWKERWEQWFFDYINDNSKDIGDWKKKKFEEFDEWWQGLRDILDENCCSNLTQAVLALAKEVEKLTQFKKDIEYNYTIWSPWEDIGYNRHEIILDSNGEAILDSNNEPIEDSLFVSDYVLDSNGEPIEFRRIFELS